MTAIHTTLSPGVVDDRDRALPDRHSGAVVTFVRPVIGFDASVRYQLRNLGAEYAPYGMLASLDQPGLEFIVVPPGVLFPDYVIEIADADATVLGLEVAADVEVFVLVSGANVAVPTVNLLGPVVVNRRTGNAAQIVLQDDRFGVAVPVDASSALA
jgi:flagellar assembly factor FliW